MFEGLVSSATQITRSRALAEFSDIGQRAWFLAEMRKYPEDTKFVAVSERVHGSTTEDGFETLIPELWGGEPPSPSVWLFAPTSTDIVRIVLWVRWQHPVLTRTKVERVKPVRRSLRAVEVDRNLMPVYRVDTQGRRSSTALTLTRGGSGAYYYKPSIDGPGRPRRRRT